MTKVALTKLKDISFPDIGLDPDGPFVRNFKYYSKAAQHIECI